MGISAMGSLKHFLYKYISLHSIITRKFYLKAINSMIFHQAQVRRKFSFRVCRRIEIKWNRFKTTLDQYFHKRNEKKSFSIKKNFIIIELYVF